MFVVSLDCSNAFDTCLWSELFLALEGCLPEIAVKLLLYSYRRQKLWICWGSSCSEQFEVTNAVGQGKVASPSFWKLYILPLIQDLRRRNIGCNIGSLFLGSSIFADDLILMSPNRRGSSIMISDCESWGKKFKVTFSTDPDPKLSKSKVILIQPDGRKKSSPKQLLLNGQELPFVEKLTHLGHIFHQSGTMEEDTRIKRYQYIQKSCEVLDVFKFAAPYEQQRAVKLYCSDYYGSNLWDFSSSEVNKYFNCWNRNVKDSYTVPVETHTFIVENLLSHFPSVQQEVLLRYKKFAHSLLTSPSKEVCVLAHLLRDDVQSGLGKNLRYIEDLTGLNPLTASYNNLRDALDVKKLPPAGDKWVVPELAELLKVRHMWGGEGVVDDGLVSNEECVELNELIFSLCII